MRKGSYIMEIKSVIAFWRSASAYFDSTLKQMPKSLFSVVRHYDLEDSSFICKKVYTNVPSTTRAINTLFDGVSHIHIDVTIPVRQPFGIILFSSIEGCTKIDVNVIFSTSLNKSYVQQATPRNRIELMILSTQCYRFRRFRRLIQTNVHEQHSLTSESLFIHL